MTALFIGVYADILDGMFRRMFQGLGLTRNDVATHARTDRRRKGSSCFPRKITKAREEGRVARSQDLSSAWSLCIALLAMYLLGSSVAAGMVSVTRYYFSEASMLTGELVNPQWVAMGALARMARFLLPFLVVMMAGGLAMNLVQVGFLFAPAALVPRFERLNPFSGFQKFVNLRSFAELMKSAFNWPRSASSCMSCFAPGGRDSSLVDADPGAWWARWPR